VYIYKYSKSKLLTILAPVLHLPANLSSYVKQEESLNFIRIILNTSDVVSEALESI